MERLVFAACRLISVAMNIKEHPLRHIAPRFVLPLSTSVASRIPILGLEVGRPVRIIVRPLSMIIHWMLLVSKRSLQPKLGTCAPCWETNIYSTLSVETMAPTESVSVGDMTDLFSRL